MCFSGSLTCVARVMLGWLCRRLAWLWGSWVRRFWACKRPVIIVKKKIKKRISGKSQPRQAGSKHGCSSIKMAEYSLCWPCGVCEMMNCAGCSWAAIGWPGCTSTNCCKLRFCCCCSCCNCCHTHKRKTETKHSLTHSLGYKTHAGLNFSNYITWLKNYAWW